MLTRELLDRNRQSCQVVFQREGHDVETLYWSGSVQEARELAREIAYKGGAEAFRIIEFTGSGAEFVVRAGVNGASKSYGAMIVNVPKAL